MAETTVKRYAIVRNAQSRHAAARYLPDNYEAIYEFVERDDRIAVIIAGRDVAGWTLDDYVIPRYASGLIGVEEIDLSHPIMKEVPA